MIIYYKGRLHPCLQILDDGKGLTGSNTLAYYDAEYLRP
jgi:hypothetical protein